MSAFNVVRFRVKPGREQEFIDTHRRIRPEFKGFVAGDLVHTGEQTFCFIGKWRDLSALEAARPQMIAVLDQLREMLEDLGGDLGLTDPVSGSSVASLEGAATKSKGASKAKAKAKAKAKGKGKGKGKGKSKAKAKAKARPKSKTKAKSNAKAKNRAKAKSKTKAKKPSGKKKSKRKS